MNAFVSNKDPVAWLNAMCELEHLAEPIMVQPILRPDYDRALDLSFAQWLEENADEVTHYYAALGRAIGPNDASCSFEEFAQLQYEQQCERDEQDDEDGPDYEADQADSLNDMRATDDDQDLFI